MRRNSFPHGFYKFEQGPSRENGSIVSATIVIADRPSDDDGVTYTADLSAANGEILTLWRRGPHGARSILKDSGLWEKHGPLVQAAIDDFRSRAEQAKLFPLDIAWGGHAFVMARPRGRAWSKVDGTNGTSDQTCRDEFRPCMIRGVEAGQRIYVIGSQYAYDPLDFEIQREDWMKPFVTTAA